jgi:hypothetical protein
VVGDAPRLQHELVAGLEHPGLDRADHHVVLRLQGDPAVAHAARTGLAEVQQRALVRDVGHEDAHPLAAAAARVALRGAVVADVDARVDGVEALVSGHLRG